MRLRNTEKMKIDKKLSEVYQLVQRRKKYDQNTKNREVSNI